MCAHVKIRTIVGVRTLLTLCGSRIRMESNPLIRLGGNNFTFFSPTLEVLFKKKIFFIYLHSKCCPPLPGPPSPSSLPPPSSSLLLRGCSPIHPQPLPHACQHPLSLGHQVSTGLSTSLSLRPTRQSSATYVLGATKQPLYALWLVASSGGVQRGPGLIDTVVFLKGLPTPSAPSILPPTLP